MLKYLSMDLRFKSRGWARCHMQGLSLMQNLNGGTSRATKTVVIVLRSQDLMLKNRHISTIFSKYLNCSVFECMHATMEHWECPCCHT